MTDRQPTAEAGGAWARSRGLRRRTRPTAPTGETSSDDVPSAGAVLLLAFGSDYSIFVVATSGKPPDRSPWGMRSRRVCRAPGAILTAGLAFLMSVGIMLDVLVVRALLLPTLLTLLGPVSVWPHGRFKIPTTPPTQAVDDRTQSAGPPDR